MLISVYTDFKKYKIKNTVLLIGLCLGILNQGLTKGIKAVGIGLLACILTFLVMYPLFLLRAMGAGDIKLLCVAAVYMTPKEAMYCIAGSFVFGGIFAILKMMQNKNFLERIKHFFRYIKNCFLFRSLQPYQEHLAQSAEERKTVIHFSLPILLSVVVWMGGYY